MFQESKTLELKQEYTKSYLKTVSAFANERDGKIIFGIQDNGNVIGVKDDFEIRQRIENSINDNIWPRPNFELTTQEVAGKKIVILSVYRGFAIPYLFKGKPYMRTDTATVIADEFRIRRWFQEISNLDFDEAISADSNLSFDYLAQSFRERLNLLEFTEGTLVTLGLKIGEQFTNAGSFFADENSYQYGIDVVKFGLDRSEFVERMRLTNQSIMKQYDETMRFFDKYYHDYEVVTGGERMKRVRLPRVAFREALANAVVHRNYQLKANIQIEFWDDQIRLISPGGLTSEMTKERYLTGGISLPRNETIANIFFRLGIIETFGTGIGRIKSEYLAFGQHPKFKITENTIEIILPVIDYQKKEHADQRENEVLNMLRTGDYSRSQIQKVLQLSSSATKKYLNLLLIQNKIERIGGGRSTKYRIL